MLRGFGGECRIFDVEEVAGVTLPLTPDMLEAAYNFLKTTPPYRRLKLPDSDDVVFKLSRRRKEAGRYQWDGEHHTITASIYGIGYTESLMRFTGHEMIHLYLEMAGLESRHHSEEVHNAAFRRMAARACRYHGWDLKAFY